MYQYTFPPVQTTRTIDECVQKILDEIREFQEGDNKDEEAIDILHCVETFIRKQFKGRSHQVILEIIERTMVKNYKRGYYDSACF